MNPQLYKWLAIINDKSSTNNIISQDSDVVNSSIRRDTENDTLNLKDKCNLTQTKHTKTGEDLWIIGLKERISADEYKKLNAKVKAVGGYYSRYAKTPDGKSIPGFIFKAEPTEQVFDVFNDFFGTTGTLKETDDVQADENIKDSQSTNNNTESDEENVSENNKTVLNSQSENDTIKEIPDLEIGDVIEYDGRQWKVTQTGLNMSFENLDKSDNKQTFSHIGGIENFKQTHDYKVVSKVDNQKTEVKKMAYRNKEYWTEKVEMMIEDYAPELTELMKKVELTEFIRHIATIATTDYDNQLETKETDPMSEMIAREYTEELIKEKLHQKLKEYQTEDDEDEEQYTMEELMLFKEWVDSLDN